MSEMFVDGDGESAHANEIAAMDAAVEEVFTCMLRAVCVPTEPVRSDPRVRAAIYLHGRPAGECAVEVPVAAGDRVTDALLGSEADWDDEMIDDAVGELCNMITGGLKRRLGIWQDGCRISLPRVRRMAAGEVSRWRAGAVERAYLLEEHRICVTLWVEEEPCAAA